jgi:hypothetical protein
MYSTDLVSFYGVQERNALAGDIDALVWAADNQQIEDANIHNNDIIRNEDLLKLPKGLEK